VLLDNAIGAGLFALLLVVLLYNENSKGDS